MNIRWFCPHDPEKTDVGRYSQALVPHLHTGLSLDSMTDLRTFHEEYESENHIAGMEPINLYNLGNSHMHTEIVQMAMEEPGIVILHDVNLLDLALTLARDNREFDPAAMALCEYGADAARGFDNLYNSVKYEWGGEWQTKYEQYVTRYPLFKTFIANARGVIVHSEYARDWVAQSYDGPLLRLQLPWEAPDSVPDTRPELPPVELIFCGHVGPNRRLSQFVKAWSEVSQPDYFRLTLYGKIDAANDIIANAESLGLTGLISYAGFVTTPELDDAIAHSHLAINLRFPTMGEASGSQLRHWAQGLPAIVSDIGWYSELSDDGVIKISPEREHEDIVGALEAIISGDIDCFDLGRSGLKYLHDHHSMPHYIARLREFVEGVAERRFLSSIFEDRMLKLIEPMCDDVNDSRMFEPSLSELFGMVEGLEKVQSK